VSDGNIYMYIYIYIYMPLDGNIYIYIYIYIYMPIILQHKGMDPIKIKMDPPVYRFRRI